MSDVVEVYGSTLPYCPALRGVRMSDRAFELALNGVDGKIWVTDQIVVPIHLHCHHES